MLLLIVIILLPKASNPQFCLNTVQTQSCFDWTPNLIILSGMCSELSPKSLILVLIEQYKYPKHYNSTLIKQHFTYSIQCLIPMTLGQKLNGINSILVYYEFYLNQFGLGMKRLFNGICGMFHRVIGNRRWCCEWVWHGASVLHRQDWNCTKTVQWFRSGV